MVKLMFKILIGIAVVTIVGVIVGVSVYFGTRVESSPRLPPQGECGLQSIQPTNVENASSISWNRVINGDTSVNNSWPWMVSF